MADELTTKVTDELVGASLPSLIQRLGLAVAEANKALQDGKSDVVFTIPEADIELAVAISIKKDTKTEIGGGGSLYAFNVNASYSNTYGFNAEASSKIRLKLKAVQRTPAPPAGS